jgi:hypothetical protein
MEEVLRSNNFVVTSGGSRRKWVTRHLKGCFYPEGAGP